MNNKIIEQFLKRSFELDKSGEYKKADRLFVKISQYTVGPSSVKWQGNSFEPSIRKTSGCLSHYFIRNGKVQWT